jgi:hypothetical protein
MTMVLHPTKKPGKAKSKHEDTTPDAVQGVETAPEPAPEAESTGA